MRLAAIDIGTNSIRLLIAEIKPTQLQVLKRQNFMTRIGQDVKTTGLINASAWQASMEALKTIAHELHNHDIKHYRAVGTNALREATNASAFVAQVNADLGLKIDIISGLEEAKLTQIGALSDHFTDDFTVIDVGGGSTEFIYNAEAQTLMHSLPLGAVTGTEQELTADDIRQILMSCASLQPTLAGHPALLCGGTATTLAAMKLELLDYSDEAVQGQRLTPEDIDTLLQKLSSLSLSERQQLAGLEPKRADIIVAGTLIIKTLVEYLQIPEIIVSSNDILAGMIYALHKNLQASAPPVQAVADFIREQQLLEPGEHILVAVSGGADSMALLAILQTLAPPFGYRLSVAHLNHQLRPEAADEVQFVQAYCQAHQLPFYTEAVDVRALSQTARTSIETTARNERYRFLHTTAQTIEATAIAVAHHQEDQAETILFNFLRGTGLTGLTGMLPKNEMIIRPLLNTAKSELLSYLATLNLAYVVDASNLDTVYTRNRIRLELLPYLEDNFNPQIKTALLRLADIVREEENTLAELSRDSWQKALISADQGHLSLHIKTLQSLPLGLQRRLLRTGLETLTDKSGWTFQDIQILADFMSTPGSARKLDLKKGVYAHKIYNELRLSLANPTAEKYHYSLAELPAELLISEVGIKLEFTLLKQLPQTTPPQTVFLDADKLAWPLTIRPRVDGDIFQPAGVNGRQKLKKFFIDHKIPHAQREICPLLIDQNENLIAVLGFRADAGVVATSTSTNVLKISTFELLPTTAPPQ